MRLYPLYLVAAAAVGALAAPAVAGSGFLAASPPTTRQSLSQVRPATVTPYKTYMKSTARGTKISISTGGNIIEFKSPNAPGAEYEHIGVGQLSEGYILCYNGVDAWDTGESASGFAAPTLSGDTVTRRTSDGRLQLRQTFAFSSAAGQVPFVIKMDVTNLSGAAVSGVILRRQVDFDIDTGGISGWAGFISTHARSKAAVMALHDTSEPPPGKEAHGILLGTILNPNSGAISTVTKSILDHTCVPKSPTLDPINKVYRGDFGDSLAYPLGSIPAKATKSVSVGYQRF